MNGDGHVGPRIARLSRSVHDELSPLGSPSAFSWRVAGVFVSLAAISQWAADAENAEDALVDWSVPSLAGVAAFMVVFTALHRYTMHRALSPVQVLFAFAAAGTARSLTVGATAVALGLSHSMELEYRLAGGLLLSPALLGVIASAVGRHDAHRAIVGELQAQRDHLIDVGQSMDEALARTEEEITMAVRAAIEPALRALDDVLDTVTAESSAQPAIEALVHLVDDQVRPIGHRLAAQDHHVPKSIDRSRHPKRVRVPLPTSVSVAEGIRPFIAALLFVAVGGPTVLRLTTFDTAVLRLVEGFLSAWCVLTIVRAAMRRVRSSPLTAVVIVSAVHVAASVVLVPVVQGSWFSVGPSGRGAGLMVAAVVGALTTIAVIVDARRASTQAELVRVVSELETVVEMIGRRARLARNRLSHVVHGRLQGALHAAAIRLAETTRADEILVRTIRDDIASALDHLDDRAAGSAALRETLDDLVAIWSGHRSITVTVMPEVIDALEADRDADVASAEVTREAVNNALRHGRARSVIISARVDDSASPSHLRHVQVVVADDGSGWREGAQPGLGTILFDELCRSWTRENTGPGTRVTATIVVRRGSDVAFNGRDRQEAPRPGR